jgi:hypothetical protein
MVTFKGEPNMLVNLKPPIGTTKHVRFDGSGEFTTENERMIQRFHHRFDSVPADGKELTEEMTDDLEFQQHQQEETKHYACKKCDYVTENKGELMAHYRQNHPKEE